MILLSKDSLMKNGVRSSDEFKCLRIGPTDGTFKCDI